MSPRACHRRSRGWHAILRELSSADGGVPSLPRVARALGTTERTLRRHLEAEGTSFRRLVDDVRRERAGSLLRRDQRGRP
ncbi:MULTISPECIES: hypothetical protein [Sorangium]|uniref:hypothetical protein n=1 Tax=Sorangium TaxID=39643 RepID=UPI001A92B5E6|nr:MULTISPECIES: hypothetical protein [Sorangium]